MEEREQTWICRIRAGDEAAFKAVFDTYYADLCRFATRFIRVPSHARDIVQQVFLRIWECRSDWTVHTSLQAYLYQAVRNRALNTLRRDEAAAAMEDRLTEASPSSQQRTAEDTYFAARLQEQIDEAITRLPRRQRTAFLLKRRHGLSYQEIAAVMDIAPKTVENHIGRALQSLREELASHFSQTLEA